MTEDYPDNVALLTRFFVIYWPTQQECNNFANERENQHPYIQPTVVRQGRTSYTIKCRGVIYQFRKPEHELKLNLIDQARTIYGSFVPATPKQYKLGPFFVYRLPDATTNAVLYESTRVVVESRTDYACCELRGALRGLAKFFAAGMNNKPGDLKARAGLQDEYKVKLLKLKNQCPKRFHGHIDRTTEAIKVLFEDRGENTWPMVVGNLGISPRNTLREDRGGTNGPRRHSPDLVGFFNWNRVDVCPFGISEACIELFLGHRDPKTRKWRLCYKYANLKKYFEKELTELMHWQWDEQRMTVAVELGQLLHMLYLVDHGPQRVATGAKDLKDTDPLWDYLDKVTFGVGMTDEELGLPVDK